MDVSPPRVVVVESAVAESHLVKTLERTLPEAVFQVVDQIPASREPDPSVLEVVSFQGRFLKSCPGTRHYHCCGYRILHFGTNCSLGCTYCILQAYLNRPNLTLFGNTGDIFREVEVELRSSPKTLFRIGTGEFTDSLLLDPWTGFSRQLVPFFSRQPNAVLELKTKTQHVENLEDLEHGGRCIVAWSLNAEQVRRREEPRTASLAQRLDAARRCAERGYFLAFHFDPMIECEGWPEGYGEILDRLFRSVDPSRIVWISLGAFRFMPDLKPILKARHPHSRILCGEFIRGLDDKMRYYKDIRVELYRFMVDRIRREDPQLCVYLCMEGRDIWNKVYGYSPEDRGGLPAILDRAVEERMGIQIR